ncbi:peptidoglycan-binding domain-containing protein [Paracoccus methylarcula]|uniref:Peptidoglycan-binding protein n=1 Tax=Paracoccus methylarcula TaxID=72022 RepID=A0A422QUS3_9RHOB|nr:peptidoglycan-binding domain-containing protein [Paracoccus methylarcula]RNF33749.1 peptidoglycan-binding protein [Paracoccus methylarcula]
MRHMMKTVLAVGVLTAGLPVAGFAQDAVIRIEAKRGEAAANEAAAGWSRKFDDVVTFPLSGGWIGIALGPLSPEEAETRLAELRAAGEVPADSFVAEPGSGVEFTPVAATPSDDAEPAQDDGAAATVPENLQVNPVMTGGQPDNAPEPVAEPAAAAPGTYIRLQSLRTQAEAEEALAEWRENFPGAGLWHLPGDWYGVALGPLEEDTALAWLAAFKQADLMPGDAFTSDAAEMGEEVMPGEAPDLPAPGEAQEMPPMDEVQKALRWAGLYEGGIDGKAGPQTRAAINAEITGQRLSPDPGTAMRKLIERRAAWRDELGLTVLEDEHTGLSLTAPMDKLQFDRTERALSIYAPKNDSGAALILFSQPGGQQELVDLSGLVTALGWVPQPKRVIEKGHVLLEGKNADHHGRAEGWVRDGRAEGFVLIWPANDPANQTRLAAEMSDSLTRHAPAQDDPVAPGSETDAAENVTGQP